MAKTHQQKMKNGILWRLSMSISFDTNEMNKVGVFGWVDGVQDFMLL